MVPDIFEECMVLYVIAKLGFETWMTVSPIVICATELPFYS